MNLRMLQEGEMSDEQASWFWSGLPSARTEICGILPRRLCGAVE